MKDSLAKVFLQSARCADPGWPERRYLESVTDRLYIGEFVGDRRVAIGRAEHSPYVVEEIKTWIRTDPRGRTLAQFAHDGIRMPTADCDPQRARSRSHRANRARRERKHHRIPNSFIQQAADLTDLSVPCSL
jgi:hypothetical protein